VNLISSSLRRRVTLAAQKGLEISQERKELGVAEYNKAQFTLRWAVGAK
jgi:hypothetical protein